MTVNLNTLNIGAKIEIISKQCPNSHAKPVNEVGVLKGFVKNTGVFKNMERVEIIQNHNYRDLNGKYKVKPVEMWFYTQNIEDIKILS